MPTELKIELTPEAEALLKRTLQMGQDMMNAIARGIRRENAYTVSHIQQAYLSFPKAGPSVAIGLRCQSNRYRQTLRASDPVISGSQVISAIGSNATNKGVSYPAVHEFGATIPPHKITAKGGALRIKIGDRVIFRKSVNHPGMTLPARAPIQRGIRDREANYRNTLSQAVVDALGGKTT